MATTSATDRLAARRVVAPAPLPAALRPASNTASAACPFKATCTAKACRGDWTAPACARERKGD